VNRYEILIGKEPPPEPPKLPEPRKVRELLIGKRRCGKTTELVNCIRKKIEEGIDPVVCVTHPKSYMEERLGSLKRFVYLISEERFKGEGLHGLSTSNNVKAFYFDGIDLVRFRKEDDFDTPFGLEKYSFDRRFVEIPEIIATCDTAEMHRYCQFAQFDYMPEKLKDLISGMLYNYRDVQMIWFIHLINLIWVNLYEPV
jgi:hypothetical protein